MLGKFAAILGPLMVGFASLTTGSPRLSLLTILVLFGAGGVLLCFVDERRGARIAHQLEQG
jgi:UMF1 family MFS transporter